MYFHAKGVWNPRPSAWKEKRLSSESFKNCLCNLYVNLGQSKGLNMEQKMENCGMF